jgi:hypothetical protein
MALEVYNAGARDGLEEEKLDQIRSFLAQIGVLEAAAMPPPMPGMDAGAPIGAPAPPPTSDLLPTAPVQGLADGGMVRGSVRWPGTRPQLRS